jgi:FkbM family methyltransferase
MIVKEIGKAKHKILSVLGKEPEANTDPNTNGEYRALRYLLSRPEIETYDYVIDVGAHAGEWTATVKGVAFPVLKNFYCVEPIPQFADSIRARFADDSAVTVKQSLLSNVSGKRVAIYAIGGGGRMYPGKRHTPVPEGTPSDGRSSSGSKKVQGFDVESITGDNLFKAVAGRPYLIKVDCDGHDAMVIEGFCQTIQKLRPVLQFEYCDFWITAGTKLALVAKLFQEWKYELFRVFPDHLQRFRYSSMCETYAYQNVIAIPEELAMLWMGHEGSIPT